MKEYAVIFRTERSGNLKSRIDYAQTKKQIREDFKANGFTVLEVLTKVEIDNIKKMHQSEIILKGKELSYEYVQQVL